MRYIVTTDGGCVPNKQKAGSGYTITTSTKYVKADWHAFKSKYAFEAECAAIYLSLTYLLENKNLSDKDVICYNIDSVKALESCNATVNGTEDENMYLAIVIKVQDAINKALVKGVQFEFTKVHAHKGVLNANSIVDRLASAAIVHLKPVPLW